jgi:hypothetical protein
MKELPVTLHIPAMEASGPDGHSPQRWRPPSLVHIQLFLGLHFSALQRIEPQVLHHKEDRFTIAGAKCFI